MYVSSPNKTTYLIEGISVHSPNIMKQKEKQEDIRNLYKEWKKIGHLQMICTLLYKKASALQDI